ncbi:MAG: hypothetical protein CVT88_06965 [Candidatus Altiarchaeales archaeon HGW-Altiarchaeales-1]|nr:MAG: hypothetical protein CVT88_06965 [Candidatus Altiarchaeales archaeon HGW-Altiarchaeales-1]
MENKILGTFFVVLVGVMMGIGCVNANGVNATMSIDDYGVNYGTSSILIPVYLNISSNSASDGFGAADFNINYDANILNATSFEPGQGIGGGDCNIFSDYVSCSLQRTNADKLGNFILVTINFSINPQAAGVKAYINITLIQNGAFGHNSTNVYNSYFRNGSLQINCTNNTQCGGNNICNQLTHLCQATTITCYRDADGDGYGNLTNTTTTTNTTCPLGYVNNSLDCNDNNASINPGKPEIYNQVDDNCNGQIDEGFCNSSADCISTQFCNTTHQCEAKRADGTACLLHEQCTNGNCFNNTVNNTCRPANWNCDNVGSINGTYYCATNHTIQNKKGTGVNCSQNYECLGAICNVTCQGWLYYKDFDLDGYGDSYNDSNKYVSPTDNGTTMNYSGSNYTKTGGDCNDSNSSIHPGAYDIPNNGIDENCNGRDNITYYRDADNDTYGNASNTLISDVPLSGYISNTSKANDCNDNNASINPATVWYIDIDNDTYGNSTNYTINCTKPAGNWTLTPGDCDDNNSATLGAKTWYNDSDNDGYGNAASHVTSCAKPTVGNWTNSSMATDCNDNNASINPNVTYDIPNNGIDENCNGYDNITYYRDADNDTYGNATNSTIADTPQSGYVNRSDKFDCNDNNANISPGAVELYYDGTDNDCNGIIDACNYGSDCGSNHNCIDHKCYKKESTTGYTGVTEGLTVTFNLGKDAKGAQVTATVGNKTSTATANANGTVTITLPGYGQGEITATKTGFKTLTKTINVYAGTLNITKISGEKYGDEFKFKVTTKDGTLVKDAEVEIYGEKLKTDAKGIVTKQIKEIRSGLEASASAKDYKGSSISFDVEAIGKLGFEGIPEKVKQGDTITITVTDENKKPVPNAKVTINGVEKTADANGKIEYKVTTRSLTLKASNDGYIPSEQTSVSVEPKIECGDGKCEAGETKENCPKDCIKCGDGVCDKGETSENCVGDCPKSEGFPLWIIGILLVIVLIAAYYFLVMKKKKEE